MRRPLLVGLSKQIEPRRSIVSFRLCAPILLKIIYVMNDNIVALQHTLTHRSSPTLSKIQFNIKHTLLGLRARALD